MEYMADPVILATGHTYDRPCIERWLAAGHTSCPATGARLRHLELTPNFALRDAAAVWAASVGVELPGPPDGRHTVAAVVWKGESASGDAPGAVEPAAAPAPAAAEAATPAPPPRTLDAGTADRTSHPNVLHGHDEIVWAVEAAPGGRAVSASADRSLRVWHAASRRCEAVLDDHARPVLCVAVWTEWNTGRSTLFSGSYDNTIKAWCLSRLARTATLTGHTDAVRAILVVGDRLWSASYDCSVRVWDCTSGAAIATLTGHTGPVRTLASVGGRVFSGSYDRTVRAWEDSPTPTSAGVLAGHTAAVRALAVGGGRLFSGSDDATVRAWCASTGRCAAVLTGHADNVRVLAASSTRLFSGSWDRTVRAWSLTTLTCDGVLDGHGEAVLALAVGDRVLASGSYDATVRLWDLNTLACVRVCGGHADAVRVLAAGDGRIYSGSYDGSVGVWPEGGQEEEMEG